MSKLRSLMKLVFDCECGLKNGRPKSREQVGCWLCELRKERERKTAEARGGPLLNIHRCPLRCTPPRHLTQAHKQREIAVSAGCPIRRTLIQGAHWKQHYHPRCGCGSQLIVPPVQQVQALPCVVPRQAVVSIQTGSLDRGGYPWGPLELSGKRGSA